MSSEAVGWVFKFSPYRGAAMAVHLAIADSVNDVHEDRFWMTQSNLAAKARVTRGTVVTTIATMISDGFIELVTDRHAAGEANEYRMLMPETAEQVYGWVRAQRAGVARSADKGSALSAQGGARSARKRERTQEVTQEGTQDDARAVPLALVVEQAGEDPFDAFWKAYPRGDGKPAARKAWEQAVRTAPVERIMEGLAAWVTYWRARNEPEFVPWAQKWLRQQQWFAAPPAIRGGHGAGPGSARVNDAWEGVASGRVRL